MGNVKHLYWEEVPSVIVFNVVKGSVFFIQLIL